MKFIEVTHEKSNMKMFIDITKITSIRPYPQENKTLIVFEGNTGHYVKESKDELFMDIFQALGEMANG